MAQSSWYSELDFDSYVLDLLLFMWCGSAVALYFSINSIKNALGPAVPRQPLERVWKAVSSEDTELATLASLAKHGESCHWFNTAISWLYLHYYNTPEYLDSWVNQLNAQLTKLGGPVQNKVEKIQHSSLPPRVINVQCQTPPDGSVSDDIPPGGSLTGPDGSVVLLCKIESQDLMLSIFASQQTGEGVRLTNCVAHVLKLNGVLRLKFFREKKDVKLRVQFDSRPEAKVEVTPSNPYQDPSTLADMGVVEHNVRQALALAVTTFTLTSLLMPGDLSTLPQPLHADDEEEAMAGRGAAAGRAPKPGEIRRFTAARAQSKIAQVQNFTQRMQQETSPGLPPTIHEGPNAQAQGGPGGAAQCDATQPDDSVAGGKNAAAAKAPLAGTGDL